jgi:hypothetical protein
VQIVFHLVCQASDPDYQQCMSESPGSVDVGVFSSFVDWLGDGAPPGTVVQPVSAVTAPAGGASPNGALPSGS